MRDLSFYIHEAKRCVPQLSREDQLAWAEHALETHPGFGPLEISTSEPVIEAPVAAAPIVESPDPVSYPPAPASQPHGFGFVNWWRIAVLILLLALCVINARAQDPASQGIILGFQQSGTTLAQRGTGIVRFNCSTGMTCTWTAATSTFTLTSSGGGGGASPCGPTVGGVQLYTDPTTLGCDTRFFWGTGGSGSLQAGTSLFFKGYGAMISNTDDITLFVGSTDDSQYREVDVNIFVPPGGSTEKAATGLIIQAQADSGTKYFDSQISFNAADGTNGTFTAPYSFGAEGHCTTAVNCGTLTDYNLFLANAITGKTLLQNTSAAPTQLDVPAVTTFVTEGTYQATGPIFATGSVDLSTATHTLTMKVVANVPALPATCTTGELAVVTAATLGQQIYQCSAGNVWTQQLNSGTATGGGITMYSATGLTVTANTYYIPVGGGGSLSTTEANVDIDSPTSATITNMAVQLSVALGGGNSGVFTFRKNGVSQSVTCTISGGAATSCLDSTHSFNVSQGDLLTIQLVTTGTIVVTPNILIAAQMGNITATGTVNTGTTGQVGYYAAGGAAISGVGPGTTSTLLHGNASGAPSFGAVVNADVTSIDAATKLTGIAPVANGGTGLATLTAHALYAGNATTAPTAVGPDASTTKALFSAGSSADPAFRAIASADLPATVVRTDQSNTYSTGAQDMGSATSLKIPTSAGAAPSASGQCAVDSTRGTEKCWDNLLATSTPRVTVPSTQLGSSDTVTCSTVNTTPTLFATTYTIPANTLIANKSLRVSAGFTIVGTAALTYVFKIKLGTVAIFATGAATDPNGTVPNGATWVIQGTAAAGASVNVDTMKTGNGSAVPFNSSDSLAQPVLIATNAQQVLAFELTCSGNTAGQSMTLRQLIVESLN